MSENELCFPYCSVLWQYLQKSWVIDLNLAKADTKACVWIISHIMYEQGNKLITSSGLVPLFPKAGEVPPVP